MAYEAIGRNDVLRELGLGRPLRREPFQKPCAHSIYFALVAVEVTGWNWRFIVSGGFFIGTKIRQSMFPKVPLLRNDLRIAIARRYLYLRATALRYVLSSQGPPFRADLRAFSNSLKGWRTLGVSPSTPGGKSHVRPQPQHPRAAYPSALQNTIGRRKLPLGGNV